MRGYSLLTDCFYLIFVFFALFGCSQSSQPTAEDITAESDESEHPAIFPHSAGWGEPTGHGLSVLTNGMDDCLKCHDRDSTESSEEKRGGSPGCKSCHGIFPHNADWTNRALTTTEFHGVYAETNGTAECSGRCHGSDLDGGLSGVSCNKCHAVYPHTIDFDKDGDRTDWAEEHGRYLVGNGVENGLELCRWCHGDDLTGGSAGVACTNCHINHLLTDDWADKNNHGLAALSGGFNSGSTACRFCHGSDDTGGNTGVSCYRCHSFFPHSSAWAEPENHGMTAKGSGKELCKGCHGDSLSGADTGIACNKCHAVYPHDKGLNSTAGISGMADGTEWSDRENHGQYVLTNGTTECAGECHGPDFTGGLSGISCLTGCHSVPYPHASSWADSTYRDSTDTSAPFHGDYAEGGGKSACMGCHGEDLKGGGTGVSCFTCHSKYPHFADPFKTANDSIDNDGSSADDEWLAAGRDNLHAPIFVALVKEGNTTECTRCHGASYDREVGLVKCTNCHTNGITHTSGWGPNIGGGTSHGTYFSTYFTADDPNQFCQDCHGAPVKFTDSVTAYSFTGNNTCGNCHSVSGRASPQTKTNLPESSFCYTCHWAYPHIGYQAPDTFDQAWGPNEGTASGAEQGFYYGHVLYQMRNPLFTDSSGSYYASEPTDPRNPGSNASEAVEYTCAGSTGGSCHYDGYRAPRNSLTNYGLCGGYCHVSW